MWPLGKYDRLVYDLKRREQKEYPVTFGILIADYDQFKARQYIINYLERFNYLSDQYINFYLPGYYEMNLYTTKKSIIINKKKYFFDREMYLEFLNKLSIDFKIQYPYTPKLILLEYEKGNFKNTKRIIIDLDTKKMDIEKTGVLLEKIFCIARNNTKIEGFSKELQKAEIRSNLFDNIIALINQSCATFIYKVINDYNKYKIEKKTGNLK